MTWKFYNNRDNIENQKLKKLIRMNIIRDNVREQKNQRKNI